MDDSSDQLGLQLGKRAVERGLLTPGRFREALAEQQWQSDAGKPPRSLGEILVEKGYLSPEQLEQLQPDADTPTRLRGLGQASGKPGEIKFGKYLIQKRLGKGGAGLVVEAVDTQLNRKVALKLLVSADIEDAEEAAREETRFVREARLSANLSKHPHIVGVYETGILEGRRYIAMELIEGRQMNLWRKTNAATFRQQVRLLRDVALAVEHAHQEGVIHRDLKPHNILVDKDHQPHVADFGVAKMRRIDSNTALTLSGKVVGTPSYMSPEQAEGRKTVDRRTDVWALGVMLYEMLTGRTPFKGDTPIEIMLKLVKEPVPPPSSMVRSGTLEPALERICLKALEKNPVDRFPSARAFADDLTRWLKGKAVQATTKIRKKPASGAWAWTGAAVLALSLIVFFLAWPSSDPHARELAQAERLLKSGNYAEAEVRFKLVLEKAPGNARAAAGRKECLKRRDDLLRGDLKEGLRLFESRRYPEALAKFGQVLARDPGNAKAREYSRKTQRQMNADILAAKEAAARKPKVEPAKPPAKKPPPAAKAPPTKPPPSRPKPSAPDPATLASLAWTADAEAAGAGLSLPPGRWKRLTHAGRPCASPLAKEVLRFSIDDAWARTCTIPQVHVEYFDGATGALRIGFAVSGKAESLDLPLKGSNQWRTVSALLPSSGPFSLAGDDLYVHRVTVSRARAAGGPARAPALERAGRGGLKPGLSGTYYAGTNFEKPLSRRIDARIDFDWGMGEGPKDRKDGFSVRWEGYFHAPRTGLYVFHLAGDDGARLFLGDVPVVSGWNREVASEVSGLCRLQEGFHRLKVEFFESSGPAAVRLRCFSRNASGSIVPLDASCLWHRTEAVAAAPARSSPVPGFAPRLRNRLKAHKNGVTVVAFSPDGSVLASSDYLGTICLWDPASGSLIRTLEPPSGPDRVRSLAFSPGGNRLVAAHQGGSIRILEPGTGSALASLPGHTSPVNSVAFSPDGTWLASASFDASARLWSAEPPAEAALLGHHAKGASAVVFSPDGTQVAIGAVSGDISIWSVATRRQRLHFRAHTLVVSSLSYSADGKTLASSGNDGKVHLWDPESGTLRRTLGGHAGRVNQVAFSGDGSLLASAGKDATVRVWNALEGSDLGVLRLEENTHGFSSVTFSRDRKHLAAGCGDWSVVLWEMPVFAAAAVESPAFDVKLVAFPAVWKRLIERKSNLVRKSIAFKKERLVVEKATVKDVTERELILELSVAGGLYESPEAAETLPTRTLSDLFRLAFPDPPASLRLDFALAFAEREDYKRAYRELDRARDGKAEIGEAARSILLREWASVCRGLSEEKKADEREQFLRRRSAFITDEVRKLLN